MAGAVYDPMKEELFTAERGGGAHLNGRRLRVSRRDALIESLLVTGFPYDLRDDVEAKLALFRGFMGEARAIRRDGAAALDLCYVAAGRMDGFWEERLNAWDMVAGKLMVEEAGGRVSRFDGTPARPARRRDRGQQRRSSTRPCWACSGRTEEPSPPGAGPDTLLPTSALA